MLASIIWEREFTHHRGEGAGKPRSFFVASEEHTPGVVWPDATWFHLVPIVALAANDRAFQSVWPLALL
jgi:hypothetical protein